MTKTEYTAVIAANQTAISALRTDLRKLRTIEKLSKSFPELKLVNASALETSITAKKAEAQKLRFELSKARRIVKRMAEIEDIEAGKTATSKAKKSVSGRKSGKADGATAKKTFEEKKAGAASDMTRKQTGKLEAGKSGQPVAAETSKDNPAA